MTTTIAEIIAGPRPGRMTPKAPEFPVDLRIDYDNGYTGWREPTAAEADLIERWERRKETAAILAECRYDAAIRMWRLRCALIARGLTGLADDVHHDGQFVAQLAYGQGVCLTYVASRPA